MNQLYSYTLLWVSNSDVRCFIQDSAVESVIAEAGAQLSPLAAKIRLAAEKGPGRYSLGYVDGGAVELVVLSFRYTNPVLAWICAAVCALVAAAAVLVR